MFRPNDDSMLRMCIMFSLPRDIGPTETFDLCNQITEAVEDYIKRRINWMYNHRVTNIYQFLQSHALPVRRFIISESAFPSFASLLPDIENHHSWKRTLADMLNSFLFA